MCLILENDVKMQPLKKHSGYTLSLTLNNRLLYVENLSNSIVLWNKDEVPRICTYETFSKDIKGPDNVRELKIDLNRIVSKLILSTASMFSFRVTKC